MDQKSYKKLFQELLPKGPAWSREPETNMSKLSDAIAAFFFYIHQRVEKAGKEIFPHSCDETMADWEITYELPEPCKHGNHAEGQTFQERLNALLIKINRSFSPTLENFEKLAGKLGYNVSTVTFPPAICGLARCRDKLGGGKAASYYVITVVDGARLTYARCGVSRCGEQLCRISYATDLECLFDRIKPAHLIFKISYNQGE